MKKIVLISNDLMHYRVPVYNYFTRRFRENGYEFIVRSNILQKKNTHCITFNYKEISFVFWKYRNELKEIKPDCVILFLHLKDIIIWPLLHWLKIKRIPVINWTKGMNLDHPNSRIRRMIFNYLHAVSDGIILYSEHETKYVQGSKRRKISIACNTVNFSDYPVIKETKSQIKKEYDIPFKKTVLFVGRMDVGGGRKKVQHLIDIFNDNENRNFGLVLVGAGLHSVMKSNLDGNKIKYLGEIHDPNHVQISKIFKMADVFSIPGHVGLGLNQAFYWGLPVVTEDGNQPPEIHYLVDGRNGYVVPENDVEKLKEKIFFLLKNDQVREQFSKNAKKDILANASVEKMFQGFLESVTRQA